MIEAVGAAVDPLLAVTDFLRAEFVARGEDVHVGVNPPKGKPERYILIGPGGEDGETRFTTDHLVDIVVYDRDAVRVGLTTHLVLALLTSVSNTPVDTEQGSTHLVAGRKEFGPVNYQDPDVPLFGRRLGVYVLMSNSKL